MGIKKLNKYPRGSVGGAWSGFGGGGRLEANCVSLEQTKLLLPEMIIFLMCQKIAFILVSDNNNSKNKFKNLSLLLACKSLYLP